MSGDRAIAKRDTTPLTKRDPLGLAEQFWRSGYFKDVKSLSQAVVKIAAGEELGLGPTVSMREIHIIEGAPSLSANLVGTLVKRSEHYDYRVREQRIDRIEIEFFEDGESVGTVSFSAEDAERAKAKEGGAWKRLSETLRYQNWPEDMLFARCLTRGVRRFCPDVMAGSPAYTPDELGAEVDERGEPVYVETEVEPVAQAVPRLPDDTLDLLAKGFELAGPELGGQTPLDGLNVLLGSLGYDALEVGGADDLREQMARWSPEQADAVNAEFGRLLDDVDDQSDAEAAPSIDGEIVEEEDAHDGE